MLPRRTLEVFQMDFALLSLESLDIEKHSHIVDFYNDGSPHCNFIFPSSVNSKSVFVSTTGCLIKMQGISQGIGVRMKQYIFPGPTFEERFMNYITVLALEELFQWLVVLRL